MLRKAVIVLGMHRSGTSLTAGILNKLGFDLGRAIMGANWANSSGFFENFRILEFNENLFQKLQVNWHNTLGIVDNWWTDENIQVEKKTLKDLIISDYIIDGSLLFKDPRICVLLPIYLEVLKELEINIFFILTFRNPKEVAESLLTRDSFGLVKSHQLWMDHMLKAEMYSRGYPRLFIEYNSILNDPSFIIHQIFKKFSFKLSLSFEKKKEIFQFVEPTMNHFKSALIKTNDYPLDSYQLYQLFKKLEHRDAFLSEQNDFDELFKNFYSSFARKLIPKVTVITVTKSFSKDLERTIRSVTSQDYPDLEYILVSCNSDNETKAIIEKNRYLLSQLIVESEVDDNKLRSKIMVISAGKLVIFMSPGTTFAYSNSINTMIKHISVSEI